MSWLRFFSSSVEQKLAVRLVVVLVIPLLLLAILASQQLDKSTKDFTRQHLANEAKDYGMLLAERLKAEVLAEINTHLAERYASLDHVRLPLETRANAFEISFEPLGMAADTSITIQQLTADVFDVKDIRRCVSLLPEGCPTPSEYSSETWQLRLVTLFDTNASIYVTTSIDPSNPLIDDPLVVQLFPFLTALLVVLALYSGALFLRSRLQPLAELKNGTQALARGDFDYQIDSSGEDEFSELGDAFNSMSNELGDTFRFQSFIADIDQAILSGADLKSVFTNCALALNQSCGISDSIFVEIEEQNWRMYRYETSRLVEDQILTAEPRIEDYFSQGQAFPILHDESVAGWLFVNTLENDSKQRVLEVVRKVTVGVINTRSSQALYQQANYDGLTGLLNRTSFSFRLARKIARVKRTNMQGILIFLDLDGFKKINDSEGHSAGDQLLKVVADRLASNIRDDDIVARFGGDEFALAIDAFPNERDLIRFLRRLIQDLEQPVRAGKLEVPVNASLGVCVFPRDGESVEGLLKNADIAMYRAKLDPGSSFTFYNNSLNAEAERQILVESKLRHAIENNEIELFLQPKLDIRTGHIHSSEALSRWTDPELGFIPPDEFIAIAERSGLIEALTANIFKNVAQIIHAHSGLTQRIAINIAPQELERQNFTESVIQLLRQNSIPHSAIELEITESNFMDHPDRVAGILDSLREVGIRISLDDFGTGYSSLNLLRQLPLDYLKIDKSFIDEISEQARASDLVEKIVEIANNLGMGVIAEGVETDEQLALLERMNCTYAQGYLIAKPLPAKEAMAFIASWNESHEQKKVTQIF